MSFLRNFRNNLIQHQSNKVYYKDARGKGDEESEEERSSSRFDTYTRGKRNSSEQETNGRTSGNYSTLRTENVVRVYLNSPGSPTMDKRQKHKEDDKEKLTRSDTFTKPEKPPRIVRSDTFTMKAESQDKEVEQEGNYNTYTRSNKGNSLNNSNANFLN